MLDALVANKKSDGLEDTFRGFQGAQKGPKRSKEDIGGTNELFWLKGLGICASKTIGKSGALRGHLKVI